LALRDAAGSIRRSSSHFRALLEAGAIEAEAAHLQHPMEGFERVHEALEERAREAEEALEAALAEAHAAAEEADAGARAEAAAKAIAAIERTLRGLFGERLEDPAFAGRVLAALLAEAARAYGEAVSDGRIGHVEAYQDDFGMIRAARAFWVKLVESGRIDEGTAKDMKAAFAAPEEAFPGPLPPEKAEDPKKVRAPVSRIQLALSWRLIRIPTFLPPAPPCPGTAGLFQPGGVHASAPGDRTRTLC